MSELNLKGAYTRGYSLIEVLVSISVLLIAIVGPMTIASQGIKSSAFSLEQNEAFFLAQEGIEAVVSLRNTGTLEFLNGDTANQFDWFTEGLYGSGAVCDGVGGICTFGISFEDDTPADNVIDCSSNVENCRIYERNANDRAVFAHNSSGATTTQFVRIVTIEEIGSEVASTTVTVRWNSNVFGGQEQSISLTTQLFPLI